MSKRISLRKTSSNARINIEISCNARSRMVAIYHSPCMPANTSHVFHTSVADIESGGQPMSKRFPKSQNLYPILSFPSLTQGLDSNSFTPLFPLSLTKYHKRLLTCLKYSQIQYEKSRKAERIVEKKSKQTWTQSLNQALFRVS